MVGPDFVCVRVCVCVHMTVLEAKFEINGSVIFTVGM